MTNIKQHGILRITFGCSALLAEESSIFRVLLNRIVHIVQRDALCLLGKRSLTCCALFS